VFRINLSDDEYKLLKRKASLVDTGYFKQLNGFIKEIIELINNQNLNKAFPGYDFKEILPELPMNENGHPNIDYEKFYIDINDLHYIDFAYIKKTFYNIFKKNSYLDLINVFHTFNNLDVSSGVDKTFISLIHEFGTDDIEKFDNPDGLYEKLPSNPKMYDYFGYNYEIFDDNYDYDKSNYDSPSSSWDYDYSNPSWDYDYPSSDWNYEVPSSDWNYEVPSSGWNYEAPSSDWNYEVPSSGWNYDYPSSGLNYEAPSSGWNYDSPSFSWYFDSPNSTKDDNNSSFNFIKSLINFLIRNQNNDNNDNIIFIDDFVSNKFDKFDSKEFYEYFKGYDFDKNIDNNNLFDKPEQIDFKTKNATLIVEINK